MDVKNGLVVKDKNQSKPDPFSLAAFGDLKMPNHLRVYLLTNNQGEAYVFSQEGLGGNFSVKVEV